MGLKYHKHHMILVPFSLIEIDRETRHALAVYLAIACKANYAVHDKMTTKLSLLDIIYTIGLTPKAGKGRVNDQVAVAVKTLKDLGYFEDAPDFVERGRLDMKGKYRYKVVKPKGAGTYATITPADIYSVAQITRNGDVSFSYDALLRVLFAIKWQIEKDELGAALVTREKIKELTGVSVRAVTSITNELDDRLIIKKELYKTSEDGMWNNMAFYTNYYDNADAADARIKKAISNYKERIGRL